MPSTPEFSYVTAEVGDVEVLFQLNAKEFGCADGDIGVAGKVTVDLEGE